jgi:hypothetical protein
MDADAMLRILDDREIVRYPVGVRFDALELEPGEFANLVALGEHPRQGFCLFVHPSIELRRDLWPLVLAYYVPPVNYGEIADAEECELFGAALLGMDIEEYYERLCSLSDSLPRPPVAPAEGFGAPRPFVARDP